MQQNPFINALVSPRVRMALSALFATLLTYTFLESAFDPWFRSQVKMKDYDAFFVSGRLFLEGRVADAYSVERFFQAQYQILGTQDIMTWTYPPHYNFLVALLALMPDWVGFVIFTSLTFFAYVLVLRQLAGPKHSAILWLLFPALVICLRTGQNGFLTGALMGALVLLILRRSRWAAVPLVLLTVKPHLLAGVGFYLLLRREWLLTGLCGGLVALVAAVTTVAMGVSIWPAFLGAVQEAGVFLKLGYYPLHRMTSLYAALLSAGMAHGWAMALQALLAAGMVVILVQWKRAGRPEREVLGVAVLTTVFFSPYVYDYDLPIMGAGIARLLPSLEARATSLQVGVLLLLAWVGAGSGLAANMFSTPTALDDGSILHPGNSGFGSPETMTYSIGAWALLAFLFLILLILRQPDRTVSNTTIGTGKAVAP
jgi:hypothetical protein